jgi:hypothetical protein
MLVDPLWLLQAALYWALLVSWVCNIVQYIWLSALFSLMVIDTQLEVDGHLLIPRWLSQPLNLSALKLLLNRIESNFSSCSIWIWLNSTNPNIWFKSIRTQFANVGLIWYSRGALLTFSLRAPQRSTCSPARLRDLGIVALSITRKLSQASWGNSSWGPTSLSAANSSPKRQAHEWRNASTHTCFLFWKLQTF